MGIYEKLVTDITELGMLKDFCRLGDKTKKLTLTASVLTFVEVQVSKIGKKYNKRPKRLEMKK